MKSIVRAGKLSIWLAFVLSALWGGSVVAGPMVKLDHIDTEKLEATGFQIDKGGYFKIEAVGYLGRHARQLSAYAWLIDSRTRRPVWIMGKDNSRRFHKRGLRKTEETIRLEPGRYELYYCASPGWSGQIGTYGGPIFDFLQRLFGGWFDDLEDLLDEFYVAVFPKEHNFKDYSTFEPDGLFPQALIQFNKVGDSQYLEQGFRLDKPTTLRIYALCEYPSAAGQEYDSPVDYGWIVNAETREKVWEMDRWNTDYAGGGRKNRLADEEIKLDKGSYVLRYVTDDSHSFDGFNVSPPYDPYNWGVAILATDETDREAFHLFQPRKKGRAVISLTRVGNDEFLSQAFELDREMSLRIYAIGEYSKWNRDFVDYGWIEDAGNGEVVWEMTYGNTEYAGGASKNRMFDGVVTLPEGAYVVRYISDDSHAYRDWNASPPFDPKSWGISIFGGKDFDSTKFHLIDESQVNKSAGMLVKMTSLGDNARVRDKFTLDRRSRIRIYAIGEGSSDEMWDFGWIVDDKTGKVVWEMTWRNTEPAGGASKNRMYDGSIILDPGTYVVNYITDGSHSFNNWNAARPRDPVNWGITVRLAED